MLYAAAALQQRRAARQGRDLRRELRPRRHAAHRCKTVPAAHRGGDAEEGRAGRRSYPLAALGARPARQPLPRLRARRPPAAGDRPARRRTRSRASRTRGSRRAASARCNRTDPVILGAQKTRLLDPLLSFLGTNDHPGRLPLQRLHRLPRRLRQRPLARPTPARTPRSATAGVTQTVDPTIPQGRARPSAQARLHALDPVEPVHDLPHAPGHEHGHHLPRLHVVGQRDRRPAHVSGKEPKKLVRRRARRASSSATPRARRCAGLWSRPELPGRRRRP